jgi:hypothetical protein
VHREIGAMAYRHSIHVEAPVEKVFDFFRDPGNWRSVQPEGVEFKDVSLTREGLGTHYSWSCRCPDDPAGARAGQGFASGGDRCPH